MCQKGCCEEEKCCNEKRVSVLGKQNLPGRDGNSAYIYVAYASLVVPGTPDVVTGFSLTTPDCWVAIRTSPIPLTPVEANFQGLWKKVCGADGAPGTPGADGSPGAPGAPGVTDLLADISGTNGTNTISVTVSGGTGPYTYQWTIEQNVTDHTISGSTTGTSILISNPMNDALGCLFKCVVTDSNGSKTSAYYLHITTPT